MLTVLYLQYLMQQMIATWVNFYSSSFLLVFTRSTRCITMQNHCMQTIVLHLQYLMTQLIATWVNSYSLGSLLVVARSPRYITMQNHRIEHVLAWRTHCTGRCLARVWALISKSLSTLTKLLSSS
ncbi:uncharacterized protein LOC120113265 [Phoenix dactylifera]|uniref:Uncharacterized protein LOC120113265 n=1 Tax=Phoenix dactylifera TaxID=42345 RepID=A0A8B9AWY1_PHODC|nr:uncharacterized protein LOC120113265 [Phoenix dactylifera]